MDALMAGPLAIKNGANRRQDKISQEYRIFIYYPSGADEEKRGETKGRRNPDRN
jgi:hypothetical protein